MSDGLALPARPGETDEARRYREALNRHAEAFMRTVDSTLTLRTAPSHVQRARHVAKNDLQAAMLRAMHAMDLNAEAREASSPHNANAT